MGLLSAVLEAANHSQIKMEDEEMKPSTEIRSIAVDTLEALAGRYVRNRPTVLPCPSSMLRARLQHCEDSPAKIQLLAAATACEWSESLQEAERLHERRKWHNAAVIARKLQVEIGSEISHIVPSDLLKALRERTLSVRSKCAARATAQWRARVKWHSQHLPEMKIDVRDRQHLYELMSALFATGCVDVEIGKLVRFFVEDVVPAIVLKNFKIDVNDDGQELSIKVVPNDDAETDPTATFSNLTVFLETIHWNLDCRWEDDWESKSMLSVFGLMASDDLYRILIDEYLEKLPSMNAEKRAVICDEVKKFANALYTMGFVAEESNKLSKFAIRYEMSHNEINGDLLDLARKFTRLELRRETTEISDERAFETDSMEEMPNMCLITTSAKKTFELIVREFDKIQGYPIKYANETVLTLRDVLGLFHAITPQFSLEMDPLDLALYYNDCFYLAKNVTEYLWNANFTKDLGIYIGLQFSDQIRDLRLSAIAKFSQFLKYQQTNIINYITKSDLSSLVKTADFQVTGESMLNELLDNLKRLQQRWQNTLSRDHYEKSMAELIGCLSEELIQCVMTIKEAFIGEDSANNLSSLFSIPTKFVPTLFRNDTDAKSLSKQYNRLCELEVILKSPMFTILNDWKKLEIRKKLFTTEEMKHLIRIMFPSNVQKANVLNMV